MTNSELICLPHETDALMPSIVTKIVFSEPSGRPFALVQLCGAVFLLGLCGYYALVENSTPGSWILLFIIGITLSGIAESLPKARRRIAGVLRLTALLMLGCLLAIVAFAPEFITG